MQVIIENVYKTFVDQNSEKTKLENDPNPNRGDTKSVLRRINLKVNPGEFMVLVGASGCGKSTLLRLIAGLDSVTAGNIWIGDNLVNDLPPKLRNIAMVFQSYALYPHLSVYDNIAFGLRRQPELVDHIKEDSFIFNNPASWQKLGENLLVVLTRSLPPKLRFLNEQEKSINTRIFEVAKLLQIEPLLHRKPKELSGGQKQRVALGRAIARNPQVFLMDEPLSNLDAKLRAETRTQIVQLQKELGVTTIYVTHDQVEAMTMGDRIAVMHQGQIQQIAKPLEIYDQPINRFVAEFIGSPPMNFIKVEFDAPLLITHPNFRLTIPPIWLDSLKAYNGQSVILGIRPEHLSLSPPATKNLPVKIMQIEALGHETYLVVKLGNNNELLQVRLVAERSFHLGEEIWLSINAEKIHFFDQSTDLAILP